MKNAAIAVGVVVLLLLAVIMFSGKTVSIEEALKSLSAEENAALSAIAAEAGFAPTQLESVGVGLLANHPRAVAVEGGHVVELRIADAPVKNLTHVAKLKGLKALWLDGTAIESLEGIAALPSLHILNVSKTKLGSLAGVAGHPALGLLVVSHCGIETVQDLGDLPQLRELDLRGNPVKDISPLVKLSALRNLDLTDTEVANLPEPKPEKWQVKKNPPPQAPVKLPENWVDEQPKPTGEMGNLAHKGVLQIGDGWMIEGTVASLRGAGKVFGLPSTGYFRGSNVVLEIEVEKGKVRGYLKSSVPDPSRFLGRRLGYVYAEATPQKSGKTVGDIHQLTGSQYGQYRPVEFVVESLEGDATNIRFKVYRNKQP